MFPSDHRQRMGYTRHEVTAPRVAVPAGKPFLALSLQYDALVTVLSFGFACCLVIATVCFLWARFLCGGVLDEWSYFAA